MSRKLRAEASKEIKQSHLAEALTYNDPTTTLKSLRIPNTLMQKAKTHMNQRNISFSKLMINALNNELRRH